MSFAFETPRSDAAALFALHVTRQLPTLIASRLILRAPRVTDFDAFAEIACSKRGTPLGGPKTREDAWLDFAQMTSTRLLHDHGLWTIGHAGGIAGFVRLGFDIGDSDPELEVMLAQATEGQGIAFEAAQTARTHGFATLGWERLISCIAPENARATALARRLGGLPEGTRGGAVIWRFRRERTA